MSSVKVSVLSRSGVDGEVSAYSCRRADGP
jgi:hypothetical protein